MSQSAERSKYVDMDGGLQRVRGNKKLYRRMLSLYLQSKEFGDLEDALAKNDLAKSGEAAHSIKGVAGNLGLTAVFNLSTELMGKFRAGERDEALIADYRDAVVKTKAYVEEICAQIDAELQ